MTPRIGRSKTSRLYCPDIDRLYALTLSKASRKPRFIPAKSAAGIRYLWYLKWVWTKMVDRSLKPLVHSKNLYVRINSKRNLKLYISNLLLDVKP